MITLLLSSSNSPRYDWVSAPPRVCPSRAYSDNESPGVIQGSEGQSSRTANWSPDV